MIANEKTHSAKYQVLYNRLTNGTPFTTDTAQARITALADALEITQEEAIRWHPVTWQTWIF